MKQIHVTTVTTPSLAPPGVQPAGYRYTLDAVTNPGDPITLDTTDLVNVFTDPDPGLYTITVQAIDINGVPFGPTAQETVTIDPEPVAYFAPALLTVLVSDSRPLETPVDPT